MRKKLLYSFFILYFIFNSVSVSAGDRIIYSFEQTTDTSGTIELYWRNGEMTTNIQVISYYFIDEGILQVSYRVGEDIPEGFNRRTIMLNKGTFPLKIVLKEQKVDEEKILDLPVNTENKYDILNLYDRGIINGYLDGTFRPQNLVNRAEFSAMMVATAAYNLQIDLESSFDDVENNFWGKNYIMTLAQKKILVGKGNGLFDPQGQITIGEVCAVIDRTFNIYTYDGNNLYKEPIDTHWSNNNYMSLVKAGIIRPEDAFYYPYTPNVKATRQQCATLLSRVLQTLHNTN